MCFSFIFLEALFERLWGLYAQLEKISDTGQKVLVTGNQLRLLARRGRVKNRYASMPEDPGDESAPETNQYMGGLKRRHTARNDQFAEQPRRVTSYMNKHFTNFDSDQNSDSEDSNGGDLYGVNGTSGTKANEDENRFGEANYQACLATDGDSTDSSDSEASINWPCKRVHKAPVEQAPVDQAPVDPPTVAPRKPLPKNKVYCIWEVNEKGVMKRKVVSVLTKYHVPSNKFIEFSDDPNF